MLWKTSYVSTYVAWESLVHKSHSWSKWLFKHLFYEVHFSSQWLLFFIYFYISFNKREKKKGKNTWTLDTSHTLSIVRPCKILALLNGCIKHTFIWKMSHLKVIPWQLLRSHRWRRYKYWTTSVSEHKTRHVSCRLSPTLGIWRGSPGCHHL